MSADEAWDALNAELEEVAPPRDGLDEFTADRLSDDERELCELICARCPLLDLCAAYATAAKVPSGFWAGHSWTHKGMQASGPRPRGGRPKKTPDAEAVTSAPITTEGTES